MGMKTIMKNKALLLSQFLLALISFIMLIPTASLAVDDSLCARVKIEIRQEMTLERQAFEAHMRINNGLTNISLENVDIQVNFADENGDAVFASSDPDNTDALFFITLDSMDNIDDVGGTGTVQPSTSADIYWLIIPAPGASNGLEIGTLYFVGATLSYTIGGEQEVTEVSPDYIYVKPMPELTLDYFLPTDVYGDDAFTPEIEPPVPFSLGVRVQNNGFGTAQQLKIDSAQPTITENALGLLIGFAIEGSEVNGQPATNSLLVDFGNIAPNSSGTARWIMTTTLSGTFVDFNVEYSHSDELGGELTSLMEAVTHFLVHDVLVDLPGRDHIRDFLARDEAGEIYTVYESDNVDAEAHDQSASSSLQLTGMTGTLTTPVTDGFMYVQLPDLFDGQKIIKGVVRSDGKVIKEENAWLSKTREGSGPWQYFINFFDVDTTGSYTVTFEDLSDGPQPPVLQFIPDKTRVEGVQLSFMVEASDPNETIPVLSADPLPAGATLLDQGDTGNGIATGIFDWTPSVGQSGTYNILFKASDGALEDTQWVTVTIYSENDSDGDGVPDDQDNCPGTPAGEPVDQNGCSAGQLDAPPIADAGMDLNAETGIPVVLDGSGSYDPELNMITFLWSFLDVPSGSTVTDDLLSDTTGAKPVFTPDVDGTYTASLIVNDGTSDSTQDEVVFTAYTSNVKPNSSAGLDQNALTGAPVNLDGSMSNDPDDGPQTLSYLWSFDTIPQTSTLTDNDIVNNDQADASFIPDVDGTYVLKLTVNDSDLLSEDTTEIIAGTTGIPPNAYAGYDKTIYLSETAVFDGSASNDPDNLPGALAYSWSFVTIPGGSSVTNSDLSGADTSSPSFIPDAAGTYVLMLTVSDGDNDDFDNIAVMVTSEYYHITGGGLNYPEPGFSASLSLDVSQTSMETGWLDYYYTKLRINLESTSITGFSVEGDTVTITGEGTVNGVPGYTFEATITDGNPDTMRIIIYNPDGTIYFDSGSTPLSSGNFSVGTYAPQYQLTTSVTPAGAGSVNPDCSGVCWYDIDILITLSANENSGYFFNDWIGCDSPSNNVCTMTMDADENVIANFSTCLSPIRIAGAPPVYYPTLQLAIDAAVEGTSITIQTQAQTFTENLIVNSNISITLQGGYDCNYTNNTAETVLNGNIIISNGTLTIESGTLVVQ